MAKALNVRERRELINKMIADVSKADSDKAVKIIKLAIDQLKDPQLQALAEDMETITPAPTISTK